MLHSGAALCTPSDSRRQRCGGQRGSRLTFWRAVLSLDDKKIKQKTKRKRIKRELKATSNGRRTVAVTITDDTGGRGSPEVNKFAGRLRSRALQTAVERCACTSRRLSSEENHWPGRKLTTCTPMQMTTRTLGACERAECLAAGFKENAGASTLPDTVRTRLDVQTGTHNQPLTHWRDSETPLCTVR